MTIIRRNVIKELKAEVFDFCSLASAHGLAYFFRFSFFERLFWLVVTGVMLVLSCVTINQLRLNWEQNPTILRADTSRLPLESVPMPSITICESFTPDKWGFLRSLLNQVKFLCTSDEECQETQTLRNFFNSQFMGSAGTDVDSFGVFRNFLEKMTTMLSYQTKAETNTHTRDNSELLVKVLERDLYSVEMSNIAYHLSQGRDKAMMENMLTQLLNRKLLGSRNLYAILNELGVTEYDWYTKRLDLNLKNEPFISLVASLVLTLPGPGKFGSLFLNYAQDEEDDDEGQRLKAWNNPGINELIYDNMKSKRFYEKVFNEFFNSNSNISIVDVAPILTPMPNYIDSRRYSTMFRHTVFTQTKQTQRLQGNFFDYLDDMPEFLLKKNYFGQMLAPKLPEVMEVMYHNVLRIGPLRPNWHQHSALYRSGLAHILSPFTLENSTNLLPFYPNVDDYLKQEFSFRPVLDFGSSLKRFYRDEVFDKDPKLAFQFDHKTPIIFNNDSAKEEANQILEELRQKYQHRQMMLFCQDNLGNHCESQFRPVLTDTGICYAMNTPKIDDVMNPSKYLNTFGSIFPDQVHNRHLDKNLTTGYTLTLVLDSHQSSVFDYEPGTFWISFNQRNDFMAVTDRAIRAQPGKHTHIQVSPSIIEATQRFQGASFATRKCRFPDELDLENQTLSKSYSFKSCEWECKLRHSRAKCGCTPWDQPHLDDSPVELCDGVLAYCFMQAMKQDHDRNQCSCAPDCQEFIYDVDSFQHNVDSDRVCDVRNNWGSMILKRVGVVERLRSGPKKHKGWSISSNLDLPVLLGEKLRHLDGAEQKFWLLKLLSSDFISATADLFTLNRFAKYVAPEVLAEYCSEMTNTDLAFVTIEVSGSTVERTFRDLQFSFTDKVSALGGTIGLFTGMSLLSVIEILFWINRMMILPLKQKKK